MFFFKMSHHQANAPYPGIAGDEMEMPAAVVADQAFAHGTVEKSKPGPFQTKGSGTLKT
jgi:hypothetical protein